MWSALSDEDGSIVYNCCWASQAQSFSGQSPAGLMTIVYCMRFVIPQTWEEQGNPVNTPHARGSLFVASYDSQS
jgi:hypothetical protein